MRGATLLARGVKREPSGWLQAGFARWPLVQPAKAPLQRKLAGLGGLFREDRPSPSPDSAPLAANDAGWYLVGKKRLHLQERKGRLLAKASSRSWLVF